MERKYLILVLLVFNTSYVFADIWIDPQIIVTYSQNKEYMLKVYPLKLPDNYYSYKYQRQLKKGIADTVVVPCHAVLYRISNSDTVEIWNKPLVNIESPVKAIVANDGKSVITIDNWYSRGWKHTFVIYGEGGELIEDFELKDISPFPIEQYLRSISSIHWGSHVEYLDNDRVEILFRSEKGEEKKRIFNIKMKVFE